MSDIPITQAAGQFNQTLLAVYKDMARPTRYLRSYFNEVESNSKFLSIEVERDSELIAVDVLRGSEGQRNEFGLSSEKVYEPPFFKEYFDATSLDFYDRLIGQKGGTVSAKTFVEWTKEVAKHLLKLQFKIDRAIENMCGQVLQTGIVTMDNGDNIDFKRKAASIVNVDTAGDYWSVSATATPIDDLEDVCKFLREVGLAPGQVFDATMGGPALNALLNSTQVKERADIRNYKMDSLTTPQRNSTGATLHGQITCGSYEVRLWTYPQVKGPDGSKTPYIDDNKVVVLPENPSFTLGYAACPYIVRDIKNVEFPKYIMNKPGKFHISNNVDSKGMSHLFDVASAPLPIPVAVDQIATLQVLA